MSILSQRESSTSPARSLEKLAAPVFAQPAAGSAFLTQSAQPRVRWRERSPVAGAPRPQSRTGPGNSRPRAANDHALPATGAFFALLVAGFASIDCSTRPGPATRPGKPG